MEFAGALDCEADVMNEYKILFTGTMDAGKSTAINVLSETATVNTDVHNSDTSVAKERTTVRLDFGQFTR